MRRAQFDENSQPHRNLAGNPSFVTSSGSINVRTNLCTHPGGELASSTIPVRTNLCVNPRGVNAFAGYGSQTVTANVSVTGNPDGITTANRVSYTGGQANPGVILVNPVTAGTVYTVSAWIYHETIPASGTQAFAQAGITSQPSPPPFVQGTWQRQSWVAYTTSGTSQIGFRISSQAEAGSFLITGVVVEAVGYLLPFFDGATAAAGEFTYAWSGTANASTSTQRATSLAGWAGSSQGVPYQSAIAPHTGTKCVAVATKGVSGDGVYHADVVVVPGMSYTFSAWIKVTEAQSMYANMRWKEYPSNATISDLTTPVFSSLVVGQWTRVSYTTVCPPGATRLQCMWRIFATHTPTTFFVDSVLIEASSVLGAYFDGSTPAAGDYTYHWIGAANATGSDQRAPIIPAVSASKSSSAAFVDSRFWAFQSTAEDGKKVLKYLAPAGTPSSSWRVASINGSSAPGWDMSKVKAGGQYTFWMRYRSSGWGAGQTFNMQIADGTGLNQVVVNTPAQPLNTTGWQELRRTFTALRDATISSQIYMGLPTIPQATTDGVFEIREWGLYEGEYTGDYIDGTKPFSKWDGTANQSSSVGYPPQLFDIAGKPLGDWTAPATYVLDDSFTTTEARTFYTVFENLGENMGGVSPILQYGASDLSDTNPNTYIQLRQDLNSASPNGTNNVFLRRTGAVGLGYTVPTARHVIMWGMDATGKLMMSGNNAGRVVDTQVMSIPHQRLLISAEQPLNKHVRTISFRGEHDAATRTAIMRYLGNKYGANVV